jgi:hypothetical protein
MPLLNPTNAPLTTLTFAVAGAGNVTDALGNVTPKADSVAVQVVVTPISMDNLGQVQAALGTDRAGLPVKVRAATPTGTFPAAIRRGVLTEATLTYGGRPALLALMISNPNPHVVGLGLLPDLGQSVVGLVVVG